MRQELKVKGGFCNLENNELDFVDCPKGHRNLLGFCLILPESSSRRVPEVRGVGRAETWPGVGSLETATVGLKSGQNTKGPWPQKGRIR